ncbi:hypothetical protein [Micromonospora sp. CPCC 206061]|uniref:hypothetical protein n=1 Tax=Micromonospora sp. CPCC 206061 TaxID=3122410 RepID=UPI002FEE661D
MLWLTWRQHRLQLLAMAAVLAMAAGYLIYRALPYVEPARLLHACGGGSASDAECQTLFNYVGVDGGLNIALVSVNLIPALVGAFWGAPLLAREYERGTHQLVWGQSVTRRRWLGAKLALLGPVALLGGAAQGALLTWATDKFLVLGTVNRFGDRFLFGVVGVVPPALWLFSLVLGLAVGLLVRRSVPAMAITLAVFAAVMAGLAMVRPYYAEPKVEKPALAAGPTVFAVHEDWTLGTVFRHTDGRDVPASTAAELCPQPAESAPDTACLARHGIEVLDKYHPGRRFWRFQWIEAGILVAGAVLIGGLTLARVSRRAD